MYLADAFREFVAKFIPTPEQREAQQKSLKVADLLHEYGFGYIIPFKTGIVSNFEDMVATSGEKLSGAEFYYGKTTTTQELNIIGLAWVNYGEEDERIVLFQRRLNPDNTPIRKAKIFEYNGFMDEVSRVMNMAGIKGWPADAGEWNRFKRNFDPEAFFSALPRHPDDRPNLTYAPRPG